MNRQSGLAWLVWVIILLAIAGGISLWGLPHLSRSEQEKKPAGGAGDRAVPVVAARAKLGDLPLYLTGLGSVAALNTVTLRSRVDGQLVKVVFNEGQIVQEGDLLAEIDPRPYQAQAEQVEGQLARDQALLKNAKIDLERDLIAKDAISAQQLATQGALVAQYEGIVKSDQAQLDTARLQLTYSRITSPLKGKIGLRLVDQGNMVHASDSGGLAVITQMQPIAVIFSLPSDQLPAVLQRLRADQKLRVDAYDRDLRTKLATGVLLAVDNQIDPTTGTVKIKASFPNEDARLYPNQFVNARLLIDERKGVVLIPTPAVQRGVQSSTYVYVAAEAPSKADPAKKEWTVARRDIVVGPSEGDLTLIERGLSAEEIVVTDGVDKLQDGSRITLPEARAAGGKVRP